MYIYKNEETGKIEVKVPVTFQAFGRVEIEFDSVEDMNRKLKDKDFVDGMELPTDWSYIDESFEVDFEGLQDELDMDEEQ